jgi:hypothetical protein
MFYQAGRRVRANAGLAVNHMRAVMRIAEIKHHEQAAPITKGSRNVR